MEQRSFGGAVYRIDYGALPPSITSHPASVTVNAGDAATFTVGASGTGPLSYQWQRNGANIAGATGASYTLASAAPADDGSAFRAIVTNTSGSVTSNDGILTVTTNQAPTAAIIEPTGGTLYTAGAIITYRGTGTDPEDGALPGTAFTWQVDFHHDTHTHPFIQPTSGEADGSFTIPTTGETSANVWYRIYLTVRDSAGRTHTVHRDVLPRKSRITLDTNPQGLQLKLDGQPVTAPLSFDGVVGVLRTIEAVSPQGSGGTNWGFESWSDGGAARHEISTPAAPTTYLASFLAIAPGPGILLQAAFNGGTDGFTYQDDAFRGTAAPDYASGVWAPAEGGDVRIAQRQSGQRTRADEGPGELHLTRVVTYEMKEFGQDDSRCRRGVTGAARKPHDIGRYRNEDLTYAQKAYVFFMSFDEMSYVIMNPLVPLYSKAFFPTRYASISFGIRMNPVFRGAPKYLRFLITTGSDVIPGFRRSTTMPDLPPLSRASARSLVAVQSTGASGPIVNDFQVTG